MTAQGVMSRHGIAVRLEFDSHAGRDTNAVHERKKALRRAGTELLDRIEAEKRPPSADELTTNRVIADLLSIAADEIDAQFQLGIKGPRSGPSGSRAAPHCSGADAEPPIFFRDLKTGKEIPVLRAGESVARSVAGDGSESRGLLGQMVRACVPGVASEAEHRALGEWALPSGGYAVPTETSAEIIDFMRAQAVGVKAGALTMVMPTAQVIMARMDSDPAATWRIEGQLIPEGDPLVGANIMRARSLGCLVTISRELVEDAANLDEIIKTNIGKAMALELDRVMHLGDGVTMPLGIANIPSAYGGKMPGLVDMGTNGHTLNAYDDLVNALYTLDASNVPEAPRSAIMAPRTLRDYRKLKDGQGRPLLPPPGASDLQMLSTTSVPVTDTQGNVSTASRIFVGHYPHVLFGIRTQLELGILRELFAQQGQVGFLAWMRADVAFLHYESFSIIRGVLGSS